MRHIILISGKDSAATAVVQRELEPSLPYEYVFNDVGAELPETYEWLDGRMAAYLGQAIHKVGRDLPSIIYEQGILPSHHRRFCTRMAKIFPLEEYLGKEPATVYYGIRADEQRIGYQPNSRASITPSYPLQTLGLGLPEVWALLEARNLLPPQFFWQSLFDDVCDALGPNIGYLDALSKPERAFVFAWRSRSNCSFCFYQRRYEFVGLLEYHPELFWQAVEMEEEVGAEGFTLMTGLSLRALAEKAPALKAKRVRQVVRAITGKVKQGLLDDGEGPSLIDSVSCGLMCGK